MKNNIILEGSKLNIKLEDKDCVYEIKNNSNITFYQINEEDLELNYTFNIFDNSNVNINILDASENVRRNIIINLNGSNSSVVLNLSSISLKDNYYNIDIHHNNKNTKSESNLHGLALDNNKITFVNNGHIIKNSEKSILSQDNKIIIMGDNNSKIEPNLFIDEYDVSANHGAYIGNFYEEDIFYLMTRGLSKKDSYNLLIHGFLIGNFDYDKDALIKIIDKYWR